MKKTLWTGLALAACAGVCAEPSLCTRLAREASRAPAQTWASADPLSAWVKPASASPSPTATSLANDARWRALLAAPEEQTVGVQRLAGTSVHLVEHVAGTASCQSVVLVDAQPGQPALQLKPPFDLRTLDLCTTQSAKLAEVLGEPALVVGGAPSMISPDLNYRIAGWTGRGWAPACRVSLRRRTEMTPMQRFCAPGAEVCARAQPVAQRLAMAYEADRAGQGGLDARPFNDGRPDVAVDAALNPQFTLFGADPRSLNPMQAYFSNADPRRLPVQVDGREWLAVVGRAGIGWREGDVVLVALFAPPGESRDAVASYQFRIAPVGLREAAAVDE